jgi:hypothetical protein
MRSDDQLGKYRLVRELGVGGMGAVWLAHDTELDRDVALKVLRPALAGDGTAQARLLREARAMAKLRHPNVITVFDAETIGGRDLVAMELIDGENMASWLASERTTDEVIAALLSAGRGLAAAHAAGMIHRDFKPHNVLVERAGRVLVTDFGLARADVSSDALADTAAETPRAALPLALEETAPPTNVETTATLPPSSRGSLASTLTRTGTLLGTPAYMAPEQLHGATADARADQFAFCVTAWEAITGKRPFPGADIGAIASAIEAGNLAFADRVPRRLRPILARGLAQDPAARWPAMPPLLDALERAWKRPKKVRDWSVAIGLGVAVFVAINVVASMRGGKHDGATCRASEALANVWDASVRAKLAAQIGDPKARVLGLIDRWANDWSAAYDANCDKPDEDAAARKLCLETQRDDMALLFQPREAADAKALEQTDLAAMLPSPEGCVRAPRVIAPPLPKDPVLRANIQELRTAMIILNARFRGDELSPELIRRTKEAIAAIEHSENASARATAAAAKSLVVADEAMGGSESVSRLSDVYAVMRQASNLVEAAGDDRTHVRLMLTILEDTTYMPGFWAELDELLASAESGVQHIQDPVAALQLIQLRARVAYIRGRWTEAIDGFDKARKDWLARGSEDHYASLTIDLAWALANRHTEGDLERALAALREALAHPVRPGTHGWLVNNSLVLWKRAIEEGLGRADAASLHKLGYATSAADAGPGDATLEVTVAGLAAPTLNDDEATRVQRTEIPEVIVHRGTWSWRVAITQAGTFSLDHLAAGHYGIDAYVSSALDDLEIVHTEIDVAPGAVTPTTVTYPVPRLETRKLGPAPDRAYWGIAVALPGKVTAATAGALQTAIDRAPWWSVVKVHSARDGSAEVLEAQLGVFGRQVTVCAVEGGYSDNSDLKPFLGALARPVHCE